MPTPQRSTWVAVRQNSSDRLHALAHHFQEAYRLDQLSEGQDRMWTQVIGELEWRSYRTRRGYKRCACDLCYVARNDSDAILGIG